MNHSFIAIISVECAHLRANSFLKPSPYVEITVDDRPPRRTEIVKTTSQPKWNESFTILVTPHSKLHFSVLDHNNFRKDTTIGEKKLDLHQLLTLYDGRLNNLELTIDLTNENKQNDSPTKAGELICVLGGLQVDVPNHNSRGAAALPLVEYDNEATPMRSVLNGIRARVRPQGTENAAPQVSRRRSVLTADRPAPPPPTSLPTSQSSVSIPYGK